MATRTPDECLLRNSGCILFLLLLVCPPPSVASPPALLSLLIPWTQGGPWKQAALQPIGEAPPILSQEDSGRQMINSFLDNGGRKMFSEQMGEDWESPRDPDLFLLTEVNDSDSGERSYAEEMEARRVKRTGSMQVGGSRMRTSVGGGLLGNGGRGSMHGGRMGGPVGGGIAGGPSLSIVNPLDVLRQRLLLEIARRRMRQSEDQILANRELLKSIGKREATSSKKSTSM